MLEDNSILGLLEVYMEMVEKQDGLIRRLGRIAMRQATDLELLCNDAVFSNESSEQDAKIVKEIMEQYKDTRTKLDMYRA